MPVMGAHLLGRKHRSAVEPELGHHVCSALLAQVTKERGGASSLQAQLSSVGGPCFAAAVAASAQLAGPRCCVAQPFITHLRALVLLIVTI